jgi:hypothetical protein
LPDAASDRVIPGDAAMCPANQPQDGDTCVVPPNSCTYGNVECLCVRVAGGREWRCQGGGSDAGSMCNCPANPPPRNSACADAGAVPGCTCMYPGNNFCVCDQLDEWVCTR